MRFQVEPTHNETQRACAAIVQEALPKSRIDLLLISLYAIIVAAAYFLAPGSRAITIVIGMFAAVATNYLLAAEGRRRVAALQGNDPHSMETHFVELDPSGLHTWCAHIDARFAWSEFSKITTNAEFYLFIRPSGSGASIPKRILEATTERELRARIREWAPAGSIALAAD
jgi:hypothetical protein